MWPNINDAARNRIPTRAWAVERGRAASRLDRYETIGASSSAVLASRVVVSKSPCEYRLCRAVAVLWCRRGRDVRFNADLRVAWVVHEPLRALRKELMNHCLRLTSSRLRE